MGVAGALALHPGLAQDRLLLMPRNRTEIAADRRGCPCFLRERPPFRRSDPYPVAMSPEGLPPPPPPPPRDSRGPGRSFRGDQGMPKWGLWVLLGDSEEHTSELQS